MILFIKQYCIYDKVFLNLFLCVNFHYQRLECVGQSDETSHSDNFKSMKLCSFRLKLKQVVCLPGPGLNFCLSGALSHDCDINAQTTHF